MTYSELTDFHSCYIPMLVHPLSIGSFSLATLCSVAPGSTYYDTIPQRDAGWGDRDMWHYCRTSTEVGFTVRRTVVHSHNTITIAPEICWFRQKYLEILNCRKCLINVDVSQLTRHGIQGDFDVRPHDRCQTTRPGDWWGIMGLSGLTPVFETEIILSGCHTVDAELENFSRIYPEIFWLVLVQNLVRVLLTEIFLITSEINRDALNCLNTAHHIFEHKVTDCASITLSRLMYVTRILIPYRFRIRSRGLRASDSVSLR